MATLSPEDRIWYVWWRDYTLDNPLEKPMYVCAPAVLINTIKIRAPILAETCRRNREAGYIWTGALQDKSGLWYYYNEDTCERFVTNAVEWEIIPPLGKT